MWFYLILSLYYFSNCIFTIWVIKKKKEKKNLRVDNITSFCISRVAFYLKKINKKKIIFSETTQKDTYQYMMIKKKKKKLKISFTRIYIFFLPDEIYRLVRFFSVIPDYRKIQLLAQRYFSFKPTQLFSTIFFISTDKHACLYSISIQFHPYDLNLFFFFYHQTFYSIG